MVPYKLSLLLRRRLTNNPRRRACLVVKWDPRTRAPNDAMLTGLGARGPVLNLRCTDVSKSHVAQVFAAVFGYPLLIDPRTYQGPCVCKSEENARHNGQVVTAPVPTPTVEPFSSSRAATQIISSMAL